MPAVRTGEESVMRAFFRIRFAVFVFAALVVTMPAEAARNRNPGVLPPGSNSHGKSYAEWSVAWLRWANGTPATINPLLGADCSGGQSGRVWFLAGSPVGASADRTCAVPQGTALFFPISNSWADNSNCEGQPPFTFTTQELRV